ncbi:hypothetical protein Ait01nite_048640 [Actinoplanes italicus]|uniref:Uncharacterized protein n=1 Tax=Actinoplanes italicus TaxID=113567 RepID=A0A2T0KAH6_9ACTN|nr:hypothetical protein [Actinoplanes italicus]PRX19966.1 hypothetical protein CLV67_109231 [Actinoplanes italicus]GIE31819.1 hypothetical protein Ait01nite_048640 [Actinoplanes italicus]
MRLIDRLGRLPLVIAIGWIVAAFLAVTVGVVGIGLVGSGLLTSRTGEPVSENEVRRALEEIGEPSGSPSAEVTPSPATTAETARSVPTEGGIVVADCRRILSLSPAQGFEVHDQKADEGEFRAVGGHRKVEVELTGCDRGMPRIAVTVDD